jgi:primosomal protein N'
MFNPLKMNAVEKRLLIGGLVGAFTHMGEYTMERVVPNYPPELKQRLDPHLPPNGELVTLIAAPVATQVAKRVVRGTDTKEKIGDIGFGMMLYSLPRLVQRIGSETAYQLGVESKPAARLTQTIATSKYGLTATNTNARATTTNVTPTRGLSKYVLTA